GCLGRLRVCPPRRASPRRGSAGGARRRARVPFPVRAPAGREKRRGLSRTASYSPRVTSSGSPQSSDSHSHTNPTSTESSRPSPVSPFSSSTIRSFTSRKTASFRARRTCSASTVGPILHQSSGFCSTPEGEIGLMSRPVRQAAENEASFRRANEGLEEKADEIGLGGERTPCLCECEDERCSTHHLAEARGVRGHAGPPQALRDG